MNLNQRWTCFWIIHIPYAHVNFQSSKLISKSNSKRLHHQTTTGYGLKHLIYDQYSCFGYVKDKWMVRNLTNFLNKILAFNFCQFCMVICFFHPRHNSQWPPISKDFYARFYPLHFLTIFILEKEPVFPFFNVECQTRELLVPFFITSLVWRGPWLGIEPGASRTRRQHSTTRLSRRRWNLTITLIHSSNEKVYIQCDYLWTIKTHDCPWFDNRKKCLI